MLAILLSHFIIFMIKCVSRITVLTFVIVCVYIAFRLDRIRIFYFMELSLYLIHFIKYSVHSLLKFVPAFLHDYIFVIRHLSMIQMTSLIILAPVLFF